MAGVLWQKLKTSLAPEAGDTTSEEEEVSVVVPGDPQGQQERGKRRAVFAAVESSVWFREHCCW